MYGRDHVRRAIRHYLEKDDDLNENPEDPARLVGSIAAAFTLAKASVAAARDVRDSVLKLPATNLERPSPHHHHYEAVWSFLSALWELIDFCEVEQEVASSDVDDPIWFFGRALDQHLGGNPFEALKLIEESGLGAGSTDPWVEMLRAEAQAASGNHAAAVASWEAATSLDPLLVPAHISVAGELESLGRDEEARAHWAAVCKVLPKDDPLAAEARRHLARLHQRVGREETEKTDKPGQRYGRLPRWGPSWVPAWPGRVRASGGAGAPACATAAKVREAVPVEDADGPVDAAQSAVGTPVRGFRGPFRAGRLDTVLGLSGSEDRDLRVCVTGGDPVDEGVVRSRSAVYLGGGRLMGVAMGPEDIEREEPDLIVLASGISPEQCAVLAERALSGRLRSRSGPVHFLYNGPAEMRDDLAVIFEDLSLEMVQDIYPPPAGDEFDAEPSPPETPGEDAAARAEAATTAAVEAWVRERQGGTPGRRRALAQGSMALAPILDWLDCGERRHAGRKPPYDLLSVVADPQNVETVAVRAGEVAGQTFGPCGGERSRLLQELFEGLPRVLPPGDTALLMGRLLGETGPSQVAEGEEAFIAASLVAGVLSRAMLNLRPTLQVDNSYGVRSSHLLVSGSLIARLPTPEYGLLAAIDGCQPVGVTRILLDPYGIMTALGEGLTAGTLKPEDPSWADGTAALLAGSCLCVAPLVQPVKWGKPGRRLVLEASVKGAWRDGERKWELCRGELLWVPLPAGRRIELVVRPAPPYSVGRGRGVEWRGDFVAGGLGLLLDGRGRPFRPPADPAGRDTLMAAWASQLIGQGGGAPWVGRVAAGGTQSIKP